MTFFEKPISAKVAQRLDISENEIHSMNGLEPLNSYPNWEKKFELYLENCRYNIKLNKGQNILGLMKEMHNFMVKLHKLPVELKGLESSSHDYNQTIHLTLNTTNLNTFWSSTGSDTKDSTEWLLYQIKESPCIISSVMVTAFQALFHPNDPIYPPEKLRFLIG